MMNDQSDRTDLESRIEDLLEINEYLILVMQNMRTELMDIFNPHSETSSEAEFNSLYPDSEW